MTVAYEDNKNNPLSEDKHLINWFGLTNLFPKAINLEMRRKNLTQTTKNRYVKQIIKLLDIMDEFNKNYREQFYISKDFETLNKKFKIFYEKTLNQKLPPIDFITYHLQVRSEGIRTTEWNILKHQLYTLFTKNDLTASEKAAINVMRAFIESATKITRRKEQIKNNKVSLRNKYELLKKEEQEALKTWSKNADDVIKYELLLQEEIKNDLNPKLKVLNNKIIYQILIKLLIQARTIVNSKQMKNVPSEELINKLEDTLQTAIYSEIAMIEPNTIINVRKTDTKEINYDRELSDEWMIHHSKDNEQLVTAGNYDILYDINDMVDIVDENNEPLEPLPQDPLVPFLLQQNDMPQNLPEAVEFNNAIVLGDGERLQRAAAAHIERLVDSFEGNYLRLSSYVEILYDAINNGVPINNLRNDITIFRNLYNRHSRLLNRLRIIGRGAADFQYVINYLVNNDQPMNFGSARATQVVRDNIIMNLENTNHSYRVLDYINAHHEEVEINSSDEEVEINSPDEEVEINPHPEEVEINPHPEEVEINPHPEEVEINPHPEEVADNHNLLEPFPQNNEQLTAEDLISVHDSPASSFGGSISNVVSSLGGTIGSSASGLAASNKGLLVVGGIATTGVATAAGIIFIDSASDDKNQDQLKFSAAKSAHIPYIKRTLKPIINKNQNVTETITSNNITTPIPSTNTINSNFANELDKKTQNVTVKSNSAANNNQTTNSDYNNTYNAVFDNIADIISYSLGGPLPTFLSKFNVNQNNQTKIVPSAKQINQNHSLFNGQQPNLLNNESLEITNNSYPNPNDNVNYTEAVNSAIDTFAELILYYYGGKRPKFTEKSNPVSLPLANQIKNNYIRIRRDLNYITAKPIIPNNYLNHKMEINQPEIKHLIENKNSTKNNSKNNNVITFDYAQIVPQIFVGITVGAVIYKSCCKAKKRDLTIGHTTVKAEATTTKEEKSFVIEFKKNHPTTHKKVIKLQNQGLSLKKICKLENSENKLEDSNSSALLPY